jgi:hypothetical protein
MYFVPREPRRTLDFPRNLAPGSVKINELCPKKSSVRYGDKNIERTKTSCWAEVRHADWSGCAIWNASALRSMCKISQLPRLPEFAGSIPPYLG